MFRSTRPRFGYAVSVLAVAVLAVPHLATAAEPPADDRLRVLLLDYHAPIEHDVLLSHLCVEPCRRDAGCPEHLVAEGVDFYNDDFAVFRPGYLGSSARFVVDVYKHRDIDLLSMSGHHASGFSGEFGRGRFFTRELSRDLRGLEGRDGFFDHPSMVMLQGCWTDVKSGFDGDPMEYVRHIIEDTAVRAGESNRLLAAIQQIAGDGSAYRELFPNACILGYQGTQVPGGLVEIYGQVNNTLRGLAATDGDAIGAPKFDILAARRSSGAMDDLVREVDAECRGKGWPCNLCRQDPDTYAPLRDALASFLQREKTRLHERGVARGAAATQGLERSLEAASLYANVRWACSDADPATAPIYPEPIDRAPHMELFLDLLMLDFGQIDGDVRFRIESELAHLLGATAIEPTMRSRLRARLSGPGGTAWRQQFVADVLSRLSTFRQRDVYHFFAEIGCTDCLAEALVSQGPGAVPRVRRENAASQLRPRLGRELYDVALTDPSPRVRRLAASRLHPGLGGELIDRVMADPDARVRQALAERLAAVKEHDEALEPVDTAVDPRWVAELDRPVPQASALARLDFESGELAAAVPAPPAADPAIARIDFESGQLPTAAPVVEEDEDDAASAAAAAPAARGPLRTVELDGARSFGAVTCRYAARLDAGDRVRDCVLATAHTFGEMELLAGSHAFFDADGSLEGATLFRPHVFGRVEIQRGWVAFESTPDGPRLVAWGDGSFPAAVD